MKHLILNMTYMLKCFLWMATIMAAYQSNGQVLDSENRLAVVLSDGTQVVLYGKATSLSDKKTKDYYYLPVNPRLSFRPDGTPEFLFTKFITEAREENGGVSGALLHFLMQWGLTPEQEAELKNKLTNEHQGAKLLGPVDVEADEGDSFKIISATVNESNAGFTESLITSGNASVIPGAKMAVASRLDKYGAQLLASTFEKSKSITDLSVELSFGYTLRYPAARGRAVIYWDKLHTQLQKDSAEYNKEMKYGKDRTGYFGKFVDAVFGKKEEEHITYDEARSFYEELRNNQIITVDFEEGQDSERVTKVREAFFEYFLGQLTDKESGRKLSKPSEQEKESMPDIKHGTNYKYNVSKIRKSIQSGRKEFNLNYRLAIKKSFAITGNLASWYDGVRDNPKCVSSVNLNDPFFQHRDINFILDLDAKEMFAEEVNYVTVNVRKRRSGGHDFSDRITLDQNHLSTKGVKATLTYARGEDQNPDLYEYMTQWSTRGGQVFPKEGEWKKGEWEGVTLIPPVKPLTIELEADLEELKTHGISRVTAQIRYAKFGQEQEKNLHISVAKGEVLSTGKLFLDKEIEGYAYRLIFNHKREGKLVTEWDSKTNDNYIYAVIPDQWVTEDEEESGESNKPVLDLKSSALLEAKDAGQKLLEQAKAKVLSKFDNLIGK